MDEYQQAEVIERVAPLKTFDSFEFVANRMREDLFF
jgi:hypothetical protein